ncbi:2-dehydro-3-deoxygluconokinase [bioreactor metagenome]|uniref:2-dehydro-3-deoxygluconokinase n=1 Tax=bioreactor metagenome TaxID=1076179 RepID=A0A644VW26_9ZZZZ
MAEGGAGQTEVYGVLCFGECNIDVITPIDEIPVKGGCTFSSRAEINVGGSMLNTASALKALDMRVSIISKIGRDLFGDIAFEYVEKCGIETDKIIRSDYQTGLAIGLVEPDGEKRWFAVRKNAADIHVLPEEVKDFAIPEYLFLSGVEIVEGRESREAALSLAEKAKNMGRQVFLDPNIRVPSWALNADVYDAFEHVLPYTDVLLANEKELIMLGSSENIKTAAMTIIDKGVRCVWLKMGDKGSSYFTAEENLFFGPSDVKAVDTSGAGDAFNAAVIYSISRHFSPAKTGVFANLYAGYTVSKVGTTSALPSKLETANMILKAERQS